MPYAVTHILVPIILVAIFRDFFLSKSAKINFPLHYVLIAGLGGALPDIDIPISMFLNLLGKTSWDIHRTFTHSISFAAIFLMLYLILIPVKKEARICNLTKHKLKLSIICLMLGIGILTHLFLDSLFGEVTYLFYPFITSGLGINLLSSFTKQIQDIILPTLDGILLVIWIVYLELKHKISDFI
jgi:membrane-bound metal-dependent hydrolase YbcI (DUF457 family)